MEIVTGKGGTAHVSSADDRAYHAGTFGTGNYVLNVGSKLAVAIETSNKLTISDGELLINGTHARIPRGTSDPVLIENGEDIGLNRIDVIMARYQKRSDIESVTLVVVKGSSVSGTPTQPTSDYQANSVLDNAEIVDMPLYAVRLEGVNLVSVTPLFTIATGFDDVYRKNEVNNLLSQHYKKTETYTQAQVNNLLAGKSATSHNHDSRYYKKEEIEKIIKDSEERTYDGMRQYVAGVIEDFLS